MTFDITKSKIQNKKFKSIINARRVLVADIMEEDPEATREQILSRLEESYGVKITMPTLRNDIVQLKSAVWYKSGRSMEYVRQRLLVAYQDIYKEAMKAWAMSIQPGYTKEVTNIPNVIGGKVELTTKELERWEGQSGNPALLTKAMEALARIEKLFGFHEGELTVNFNQQNNTQNNLVVLPPKDDGGVSPQFLDDDNEDEPPMILDDDYQRNGKS